LWGCRDVALALSDSGAAELDAQGTETLARALPRYDTGRWSRYDLYPHPVVNVAHLTYHRLHIAQLRAMAVISSDARFERTADRFERYAESRTRRADAFARKALFRVAVPRNQRLARHLPWAREAAS
jgi:heparosan-N-sulfate-glucuronate 5-epimerase